MYSSSWAFSNCQNQNRFWGRFSNLDLKVFSSSAYLTTLGTPTINVYESVKCNEHVDILYLTSSIDWSSQKLHHIPLTLSVRMHHHTTPVCVTNVQYNMTNNISNQTELINLQIYMYWPRVQIGVMFGSAYHHIHHAQPLHQHTQWVLPTVWLFNQISRVHLHQYKRSMDVL